ncbi:hypothetical protein ACFXPQ_25275 [Streptomyces lydicus]|uniref:hypothetical protein n=1 Tax=Streptomyces lydicus TaxID=47763 RepID=UPI003681A007
MSRGARLTAHGAVSASLALRSDRALCELVDTAVPLGSGIGGTSALLEVAGTPVFVKRVPLTDPERHHEHIRSTANLFELPVFCQYGIGTIGAPGFGAWRELAVHTMTTNWVVTALYGCRREDRDGRYELVRAYAEGQRPTGIPEEAAAILARHAPIAAVLSDFHRTFQDHSRQTPYPLEEIRRLGGTHSSSLC